jgi:hypothetical protein
MLMVRCRSDRDGGTQVKGTDMRTRFVLAIALAALMLPAGAFADEIADICYVDPTAPECAEVSDDVLDSDEDDRADDGGGDSVTEEAEELDAEVLDASLEQDGASLAATGFDTPWLVLLATALLAAGGIALLITRRTSRG